jgi:hypothetical protein
MHQCIEHIQESLFVLSATTLQRTDLPHHMSNYTERGAASQDDYEQSLSIHSNTLSIDGLPKLDIDYVAMSESADHCLTVNQATPTYLVRRHGLVKDKAPICRIVILLLNYLLSTLHAAS